MNEITCYCNGSYQPLHEASLPVNDLGYQRGYGIFDFLRVTGDTPLYMNDHLARFYNSAAEMRLPLQQNRETLEEIIARLIATNKLPYSGIRIMLSGGPSADGYQVTEPRLVIVQSPLVPPSDGLPPAYKIVSYNHQRQMPHVKTTDYLMAIWLQPWVKQQSADDVLYHNNGVISEMPRSNFFVVMEDDTVVTPAKNILKGITRKQVLEVAVAAGIKIIERDILIEEIKTAKSAFISSSTKRIIPVKQVDDIEFKDSAYVVADKLFGLLKEKELIV